VNRLLTSHAAPDADAPIYLEACSLRLTTRLPILDDVQWLPIPHWEYPP